MLLVVMMSSSQRLSIAARTAKILPDNRFPLHKYFRAAQNLLKQALVFREENNVVELYISLLRFASLVGETIPEHQEYGTFSATKKAEYTKKLKHVLSELEKLKPEVQKELERLNNPVAITGNNVTTKCESALATKGFIIENSTDEKFKWPLASSGITHNIQSKPYQIEDQLNNLLLNLPQPKDETLSRHSFLGRDGIKAHWDMPVSKAKVQYPSYIDASRIEIPSLDLNPNKALSVEVPSSAVHVDLLGESTFRREPVASHVNAGHQLNLITQPSPPPVPAFVQNLPTSFGAMDSSKSVTPLHPWKVDDPFRGTVSTLPDGSKLAEGPKHLHISAKMMDEFMKLASQNTDKNIETCGVLAGSLKNAVFYVTTLIIPKQQATSDSCQTVKEEEIFDCQDKRGLFQLGWIHTHPKQICFMSSIDLHTHYSYQVMLPEAVAIVMAPTDATRKYGIFRLSEPGGVKVIQGCQMRGHHPHEQPSDGSTIYEHCSHVLMNPVLRYQVIDLR